NKRSLGICGHRCAKYPNKRGACFRLNEDRGRTMCLPGMATALKRFLTVCLALAFLVGVSVQLVPSSMAEPQATVSAGMADCCDSPQRPCTGHMPNCLDHGGCISVSLLPTSPA